MFAAAVLATAAACSAPAPDGRVTGATSSPTTSPPPATSSPRDLRLLDPRKQGLEVGFGEFAIVPEAKTIRPGRVTFVVHNGGKLVHGFEMKSEDEGSHSGHGGGDDRFKVEAPTFGPGDTVRVVANLQPGVYELECYVSNHDELGMRTILIVDPDAPMVKPAAESPGAVSISGFAFKPSPVEVPVGTRLTWTNADPTEHTVTADGGAFGSDPFGKGERFAFTFDRTGTFAYRCAIHPTMKGTVVVR